MPRPACCALLLGALFASAAPAAAPWPHPLYLSGGDWWSQRITLQIHNQSPVPLAGTPLAVPIGDQPHQAALAGVLAETIRVCDARGAEMLFDVVSPSGDWIRSGPIPDGSSLVLPVECAGEARAEYHVYFGNPAAGAVPDFLGARLALINGDLEAGQGDAPTGWIHDQSDPDHVATWTTERPHSGQRCLKTVVKPGAEPTWISTRQRDIAVTSGARYRLTAWVRAEDVRGFAGWYLHVGNAAEPMLHAPMLVAGDGSFDWKQVTAEFEAPAAADRLSLGTVLRGTGTAWFDTVKLEQLSGGQVQVTVRAPERIELQQHAPPSGWLPEEDGDRPYSLRAVVQVVNPSGEARENALLAINLGRLRGRTRGRMDLQSLRLRGEQTLPHVALGDQLLAATAIHPRSVQRYHVYVAEHPAGSAPLPDARAADGAAAEDSAVPAAAEQLVHSPLNLVTNGGCEDGGPIPTGWKPSAGPAATDPARFDAADPQQQGLGSRCLRMHVPATADRAWRGWRQDVTVQPGRTYLVAAWIRSQDLSSDVRIHVHRRRSDGQLSAETPYASVGPSISGTTGWTLLSGSLVMPADASVLQLHLTMEGTGTVWHDNILVSEICEAELLELESRRGEAAEPLAAWQVPAVVKVFRDDPPEVSTSLELAAARNEWEPLQLAVRSSREQGSVQVQVEAPRGPGGRRLDQWEINVVGYVPVDYPTNYYRWDGPAWHRKIPAAAPACDGWSGWWPDPLLPTDTFSLPAERTQPVWITFRIPNDAAAGDYRGAVRLLAGSQPLCELPLHVRVWDFALPDANRVAAIYDVRTGPGGADVWGKSLDEMYPEIIRFLADRRLCPDTIRPAPRFWMEDGQVRADFTTYDAAAEEYFDRLGLPVAYTPWNFYLFGWGHPPKALFGQQPYADPPPFDATDRSRLRPEYRRVYQQMLKLFWDHLREKGWDRKVVLYISDEPFDSQEPIRTQMKALCRMIHEVDPAIPIYSSTWHHVPDWDGSLDIWGIGHDGRVPVAKMQELRAGGARIWFTTDGQMCTDTPYCAVERLLPHYCFHYGAEAYEFWGVSWLTYDPYRFGWHAYIHQSSQPGESTWVRYPNGDGFLIYPGGPLGRDGLVSSIRLEQAREGVEDHACLDLLNQLLSAAAGQASAQRGAAHAAGRRALESAAGLVQIPNAGGRYSTRILPDPQRLYQVRREVAEAIVKLQKVEVGEVD